MKNIKAVLSTVIGLAALSLTALGLSTASSQSPTGTPAASTSAALEKNKATLKAYFAAQSSGNLNSAFAFFSPDIKAYNALVSSEPLGLEGVKGFFTAQYDVMPDLKAEILDAIAEGDKVAVRFRLTGTQRKEFMGQPAGTKVDASIITIYRLKDDKIIEVWS